MRRSAVASAALASVGYEVSTAILELEFQSGTIYQYFDVASETHQALVTADSLGRFFNTRIRTAYRHRRVR